MVKRALDKLTDGLEQALQEAKATHMEQLEQFMKNQMQEQTLKLKRAIEECVEKGAEKGAEKVVKKLKPQLDVIQKEISKQSQS